MRLDRTIDELLAALRDEIAPDLGSDGTRATLRSIMHILTGLKVNAAPPEGAVADAPSALAIETDRIDVPFRPIGGEAAYDHLDARFAAALAESDGENVLSLLATERAMLDRLSDQTWAILSEGSAPSAAHRAAAGRETLEAYLRAQTGEPTLRLTGFRLLAGGRSKQTALISIAGSERLPGQAVVRQDAAVNISGGPSVTQEFGLLQVAHGGGVRVAEPFLLEETGRVMGTPFMLIGRLSGSMASGLLQPPRSAQVALALAGELAKLHAIPVAPGQSALTLADMEAELEMFAAIWHEKSNAPCLAMRYALDWLKQNIALAVEGEPCLTHRDALFHNVLADGDELTGLLDWEFARCGYAAEDFGWIRASVEERVSWTSFCAAYRDAGGRTPSAAQLDFYAVWGATRLLAMLAYSNWLVENKDERDIEHVCVAFHETQIVKRWLSHHVARVQHADPRLHPASSPYFMR